jgi:hypothetical protein
MRSPVCGVLTRNRPPAGIKIRVPPPHLDNLTAALSRKESNVHRCGNNTAEQKRQNGFHR